MFAIVSLLDESTSNQVRGIWQKLNEQCDLKGIRIFPNPHFTWVGAECCDDEAVDKAIANLAVQSLPMTARTTGIGIFTGANPVIYLPLVKDDVLVHFHKKIWDETFGIISEPIDYYLPEFWVPHITLAMVDVNQDNLTCALSMLAFQTWNFVISINNLSLVYQSGLEVGQLKKRFEFQTPRVER